MGINFPDAPTNGQIFQGFIYDGEKWLYQGAAQVGAVRYDIAQSLTSAQTAQARANIAVTKKNYIINGAMQVSQENGTTAGTATGYYPADMFQIAYTHGGTSTVQQVSALTPAGSPNRIRITATVADAAVAASDRCILVTAVEGYRASDLRMGSAAAKTITVQFGCKGPAGTYCVAVRNNVADRSYVAEYVIAAGEANTDVVKSVTLVLDTIGAWPADNTGTFVSWAFMCGTTFQGPVNTWSAGNFQGSSNQFNFMGTINNVFELFDVSLTEGSVAPPFQLPDYATELALCQRYYVKPGIGLLVQSYAPGAGYSVSASWSAPASQRAAPAITANWSGLTNATSAGVVAAADNRTLTSSCASVAAGGFYGTLNITALNARL